MITKMRFGHIVGGLSGAVLLTACATSPALDLSPLRASDVFLNVQCELKAAIDSEPTLDYLIDGKGWQASYSVSLQVLENGGGKGDTSIVAPLTPGLISASLNLGGSGEATRTEETKFNISVKSLTHLDCSDWQQSGEKLLAGELGFREWLLRLGTTRTDASLEKIGLIQSSALTVKFVIKANVGLGPKFTMFPIGPNTIAGGFSFDLSRTKTHRLILALGAPQPEVAAKKLEVVIVEDRTSGGPERAERATPRTKVQVLESPAGGARQEADKALNRALFFEAINSDGEN